MSLGKQFNKNLHLKSENKNVFYMISASSYRDLTEMKRQPKSKEYMEIRKEISKLTGICESVVLGEGSSRPKERLREVSPWCLIDTDGLSYLGLGGVANRSCSHRAGAYARCSLPLQVEDLDGLPTQTETRFSAGRSLRRRKDSAALERGIYDAVHPRSCSVNMDDFEARIRKDKRRDRIRNTLDSILGNSFEENAQDAYDADADTELSQSTRGTFLNSSNNSRVPQSAAQPSWIRNADVTYAADNRLSHVVKWRDALKRAFRATDKSLARLNLREKDDGELVVKLSEVRSGILKKLRLSEEVIEMFNSVSYQGENWADKYLHLK